MTAFFLLFENLSYRDVTATALSSSDSLFRSNSVPVTVCNVCYVVADSIARIAVSTLNWASANGPGKIAPAASLWPPP